LADEKEEKGDQIAEEERDPTLARDEAVYIWRRRTSKKLREEGGLCAELRIPACGTI